MSGEARNGRKAVEAVTGRLLEQSRASHAAGLCERATTPSEAEARARASVRRVAEEKG